MILKSFTLIGLLILPGCVTFPFLKKNTWDFLERLFITLLLSILVVSLVGVLLAELDIFSLSRLITFSSLYTLCMFLLWLRSSVRKRRDAETRRPDDGKRITVLPHHRVSASLLICVLLLAVGLGSFSFEYILGGRDPGVYMNTGINLAYTGSLKIQDKLLGELNPSQQELFYSPGYYKYPGFFVDGPIITPQFLPLFPVWVALFYLTLGLKGTLWINTFFGVLGILGVYLVGRQVFNPPVGLLSALLLTISPTQIWYMRYPSPEILLQFLTFAGIYTYHRSQREANGPLGGVSAIALGLTLLAKPLAFLLLIPIGLYFYWKTFWRFTALDGYFVLPFGLCLLHAILHIYNFNSYYILGHLERFKAGGFLISLWVVFPLLLWIAPKFLLSHPPILPHLRSPTLRLVSAILLVALGLYGYFIRPRLAQEIYHAEMGRWGRDYAMDSLVHLGWYFSPVVVFLGITGASLFIYSRVDRVNLLFFLIGLIYSFFVLKGTQDAWDHIWIMRRYVPVIIPTFLLFSAYALWRLYSREQGAGSREQGKYSLLSAPRSLLKKYGKPLSIFILCFLLAYPLLIARPMIKHREYRGIIPFMDRLSEVFKDPSIVVLDTFDVSLRIAPPLEYIYRKDVLVLYRDTLENYQRFLALVHQWIQKGREAYFITPLPQGLELVKKFTLKVPEMEYAIGHLPKKINQLYSDLYVYRLTERDGTVKPLLKLGVNDFGLIEGFYSIENLPEGGRTYRWTKGMARVVVPRATRFRIRMRGWRPDLLPRVSVEVLIGDTLVTALQPSAEFQDYEVRIPADLAQDPLILTLRVPTWNPKTVLEVPDDRDLGVMVEEIAVIE